MRLRNTEHIFNELSTKMDSKCTHKKDSLHVFWMLRVIYKKTRTEPAVFSKPNRNRTELEKSIPHIPNRHTFCLVQIKVVARLFRQALSKILIDVLCDGCRLSLLAITTGRVSPALKKRNAI